MADSILRLKVDSQEYDAQLKRASSGLQRYIDDCRKVGGTLSVVEEDTLKFVQALSQMPTVAQGGTQSLREMTRVTTDLTMQYRSLTDEEKNSPFGRALEQSIRQLTERAGQARDAMADVQAAINNAASDTRTFDQLAGAASFATASFQTLQGACKLLGIDMGDNVEVIAKLQAAMSVTNGLSQLQTALQQQSALMQGVMAAKTTLATVAQEAYAVATGKATLAQAAFNIEAKANPYVLIASAVAAAVIALGHYSSKTKEAADATEKLEQADAELKAQNDAMRDSFAQASAQQLNTASIISSLQVAYQNANSEMEKTEILKEAADKFRTLGLACNSLTAAQALLIDKGDQITRLLRIQGSAAALAAIRMEEYRKSFTMLLGNGYDVQAASILAGSNETVRQLDAEINRLSAQARTIQAGLPQKGSGSGSGSDVTTDVSIRTTAGINQLISDLRGQLEKADLGSELYDNLTARLADATMLQNLVQESLRVGLGTALFDVADESGRDFWSRVISPEGVEDADWQGIADAINKKRRELGMEAITIDVKTVRAESAVAGLKTGSGLDSYIKQLKSDLQKADFGSDIYDSLTARLADATMLQNLVQESLRVGLGTALFDVADESGRDFWSRVISPEGVEDADWQGIADAINRKRKEMGLESISLDVSTGKLSSDSGKIVESSKQVVSGLQQVTGGLQQAGIKLPDSIQNVMGILQGVISGIEGFKTISAALNSSQVSAQQLNTGALMSLTAAVNANTAATAAAATGSTADTAAQVIGTVATVAAFKDGGKVRAAHGTVVPGTHYSGDVTPVLANAGELILNRAQQGNIASQLSDTDGAAVSMLPYVTGQMIMLGINNHLRGAGQGEIVTTRMLRQMGIH